MKVAICYSGELRSIDKTFQSHQNVVLSAFEDFDLFVHLWKDDPDLYKIKYLIKTNKIKDIEIEDRLVFNDLLYYSENNITKQYHQSVLRQLYCLKTVNDIKSNYEQLNDFKYDLVVRIRPDLLFLNDDKLDLKDISIDKLNLMNHDYWHGYCDRFYLGNSSIMDIVSNRIEMKKFYSDLGGTQQYEGFLKFVSDYNSIKTSILNEVETCLLRTNGELVGEIISRNIGELRNIDGRIWHVAQKTFI